MAYLLDTTVILDHVQGYDPATWMLRRLIDEDADLLTCDVVICEALAGGTDEQREAIGHLIAALGYVPVTVGVAVAAANARHAAHSSAGHLSLADALIGAVADSVDATLVTRGRREAEQARRAGRTLTY